MLLKKEKAPKRKSSIDIIREEINLEEMQDTTKAKNDNSNDSEYPAHIPFGALFEKTKKNEIQRKSSIDMIRDEI